jgi:hypothetical protein
MSNFHFDLSLKLSQGEAHDFSGEVQKFSGEVQNDLRGGAHLPTPSKSDHDFTSVTCEKSASSLTLPNTAGFFRFLL